MAKGKAGVVKKGAGGRKPAPKVTQNDTPKKGDADYQPRVWMKAFISILSLQGNVSRACDAAKIERKTAYRAKDSDPVFAEAWADALDVAADALEAEAWRRAVDGVEKPVGFYQGEAGEY